MGLTSHTKVDFNSLGSEFSSQGHFHPLQLLNVPPVSVLFLFIFVTPEGFTTVVANEGLEKARAYFNQVPRD